MCRALCLHHLLQSIRNWHCWKTLLCAFLWPQPIYFVGTGFWHFELRLLMKWSYSPSCCKVTLCVQGTVVLSRRNPWADCTLCKSHFPSMWKWGERTRGRLFQEACRILSPGHPYQKLGNLFDLEILTTLSWSCGTFGVSCTLVDCNKLNVDVPFYPQMTKWTRQSLLHSYSSRTFRASRLIFRSYCLAASGVLGWYLSSLKHSGLFLKKWT